MAKEDYGLTDDDIFICENGSPVDLKLYVRDLRDMVSRYLRRAEAAEFQVDQLRFLLANVAYIAENYDSPYAIVKIREMLDVWNKPDDAREAAK